MKLEIYCGIRVSRDGLTALYSYLPMFYVPWAAWEEMEDVTVQLYEKVQAWMDSRFQKIREGTVVRVNMSFYNGGAGRRNVAEFTSLVFDKS